MLRQGILNPHVLSLIARVRHTNTLVIADRGFPYWPELETVDLSLVDDVPTVRQVLGAIKGNFVIGGAVMAEEFLQENDKIVQREYERLLAPATLQYVSHVDFKRRVPQAVGLIRTGDTTQYGNLILESA